MEIFKKSTCEVLKEDFLGKKKKSIFPENNISKTPNKNGYSLWSFNIVKTEGTNKNKEQ